MQSPSLTRAVPVKEAYVAGADGAKKYKVVLVDKDQKEQTVVLNEKGEVIE